MKWNPITAFDRMIGLKWKTLLGLGFLLASSLIIMGGVTYYQGRQVAIAELLKTTGKDIEKDTAAIENFVQSAKEDLMVMADVPPIHGILRAQDNGGIDPVTGEKTEAWNARMEKIFRAFMKYHPEYLQLSYFDEKGQEIVWANSTGIKICVTPQKELQNKQQSLYFTETIKLKEDEAHYSEVNLHCEQGVIQPPHIPIFKIATPVYDSQKKARGIVVINISAEAMFAKIRTALGETKRYLINQDGYFLVHPDRTWEFGFELGKKSGIRGHTITDAMPEFPEAMKTCDHQTKYHKQLRHVDSFKKVFYDPQNKNHWWALIYEIPETHVFENINNAGTTMLFVGFLIMAGSLAVITWISSRKIIYPILQLSKTVNKIEQGDFSARIPDDGRKDELGELAVSVNRMADIIEQDITELKHAEDRIKEYAETLEAKVNERTRELQNANLELKKLFNAIEQSDESIVITDINGTIQYVNPAFSRRTGYSKKKAIGSNPRILKSGQNPIEVYDDLWKTILSNRTWKGTLINKKRSGELYYEEATIAPVVDEQGKITNFVAAKIDVTNRVMAEKELKHKNDALALAKEAAEAANQAKSDFLANMSHELRTPLNAIIGFSDIMINGLTGPLTDEQTDFLKDIGSSGKHLLTLINDILDLSKVEAGKMSLEPSEFEVQNLIERCIVMFKEKSLKHGIHVEYNIEDVEAIIADEMKVKQVLMNLLSNAFKHTPDRGSVRVSARKVRNLENDFVEISVADTGPGISEANITRLFQPFQQLETTFSSKTPGTGLGLNLCKKFVELHGGKIWVESEVGKGSKFIFVLPAVQGNQPEKEQIWH
ncbi:MAG TPA: hypothetical protein DEQ20_05160 [Desulfobulbaceae bacterium]|nr:MAG: hypothetical protein A2520_06345 [Deltaproteobacteria bacterium RIFOXYD12_FULL_53_23]HCC54301.1 hypothetical protein [Desulfobulbaceae bacterium]